MKFHISYTFNLSDYYLDYFFTKKAESHFHLFKTKSYYGHYDRQQQILIWPHKT